MLMAVLMRDHKSFDGLLHFFLHYRDQNGLMNWQIRGKQGELYLADDGHDSATDGDIDIACALALAARIFPQGSSSFPTGAYLREAVQIMNALRRHCVHPELGTPLLGDWCSREDDKSRRLYNSLRTSDMQLSAFYLFSRCHPDANERAAWSAIVDATIDAAVTGASKTTGLLPDFLERIDRVWIPARGKLLESDRDPTLSWNACRTPWRLAHYFALTRDGRLEELLQQMYRSLCTPSTKAGSRYPNVPAGISLDGKPQESYTDRAFIAPAAYLALVTGHPDQHQRGLQAIADNDSSYFGDAIDLTIAVQAQSLDMWR